MAEQAESKQYLFIPSPPYCGSTLLWEIVGTSPTVSSLPREGQAVEEVAHVMPGSTLLQNPDYEVPWAFVKERWEQKWDLSQPILLEKSPSNIHRAPEMQAHFEPASFIALMRDPYAFCEGWTRRKGSSEYQTAAQLWIRCAQSQRRNLEELKHALLVRYEDLTEQTETTLQNIVAFLPELRELQPSSECTFTVMGPQETTRNVNPVKIQRLTPGDIRQINSVLSDHRDLMAFFDYRLRKASDQSFLRAWNVRITSTAVRGLRWMERRGLLSKRARSRIEEVISPQSSGLAQRL